MNRYIVLIFIVTTFSSTLLASNPICRELLKGLILFPNKDRAKMIIEPPQKELFSGRLAMNLMPSSRSALFKQFLRENYQATPFHPAFKKFPNLKQAEQVRFISFGDSGYALREKHFNQVEVAKALKKIIDFYKKSDRPVDFIASTGDFFYESRLNGDGLVRPVFHLSPQEFQKTFTDIYTKILGKDIPFFIWVGNHETDPIRRIKGLQATIDFNLLSSQYFMLDGHWGVPNLPPYLRIGGIDSNYYASELFYKEKHIKQISEMTHYFTHNYPQDRQRLNILFMHHPPAVCGEQQNPCLNGTIPLVDQVIEPFAQKARIQNIYAGHVHELSHITTANYDLFTTGGGGARLSNPNQASFPDRLSGEGDGKKIFNFHQRAFGFTVTTVRKDGVTIVDYYGFHQDETAQELKLLYSQIFEGFDSFGAPHLR